MGKRAEAAATVACQVVGRSTAGDAQCPSAERSASQLKVRLEQARQRQARVRPSQGPDESGIHPLRSERMLVQHDSTGSQAAGATPLAADGDSPSSAPESARAAPRRTTAWVRAVAWLASGALLGVAVVTVVQPTLSSQPVLAAAVTTAPADERAVAVAGPKSTGPGATIVVATEPAGAEVVYRGAVVANTPWSLPRPSHEALYLIRRTGYHPQLIRLSPHTGDSIVVSLRPVEMEFEPEVESPTVTPAHANGGQAQRARGNDVGRQSAIGRGDGSSAGGGAR